MDHSYLLSLSSFTTVPSFLNFPHLLSWIFLLLFFWNWQRWDLSVFSSSWIPVSFGFVPFLHGISSLDLSSDNFRPFIFFAVFLFRALFSSYFISRLFFHQRLPISFGLPPFFPPQLIFFLSLCLVSTSLPTPSLHPSSIYLEWLIGECLLSLPTMSSFSALLLCLDWFVNATWITSFLFATCSFNLLFVAKINWKGFFVGNLWL